MSEHKPFYLKHAGFAGRSKGSAKPRYISPCGEMPPLRGVRASFRYLLKDLVYLADGAPADDIAIFTNYIVIGGGGKNTQGYKKVERGIEQGINIALTPEQFRDIAEGRLTLPEPHHTPNPSHITHESAEAAENNRQTGLFLWQSKRDLYFERYGLPIAGDSRFKISVRVAKAVEKVFEADIISVRDNPEYSDRTIDYFTAKWRIPQIIYQDCIANSITTTSPLPRWYLLVNSIDVIIGGFGLITNDFISRQDLWPWLCALYVEEPYRGHAFGAKMLEHGKREAKRLGYEKLYLCTDHIGYYEKYGWRYIGDGYSVKGEPGRIYESTAD